MANRVSWGPDAYAGFWRRLGGVLIDGLLLSIVWFILSTLFGPAVLDQPVDPQTLQLEPGYVAAVTTWSLISVVLWLAYETIFLSTLGWTPGKRVVGVEVRGQDGALLSVPRALGRTLGKYVSALPLYLGFLWAAWDPEKQTWHDKFVSSYAVQQALVHPAGAPAPGVDAPLAAQPAPAPQPQAPARSAAAPGFDGWGIPGQPPQAQPPPAQHPAEPREAPPPPAQRPAEPREAPRPADEGLLDFGAASETRTPPPAEPADDVGGAPDDWSLGDLDTSAWEPRGPQPDAPAQPDAPREPARPTPADAAGAAPDAGQPSGAETADPNLVAIREAGIPEASADWLGQVAGQVDARLDRVSPQWRSSPQAEAARACAFGLLIGHLTRLYAHMAGDLEAVSEAHPSFTTLPSGNRLETLREIAEDPARAAAWLGPLVGTDEVERVRRLFE